MKSKPTPSATAAELRRRAEARLRERRETRSSKAEYIKSAADTRRLFHELQVQQVELELQNAALLEARDGMESLLEQFTDLYDFAPVGYFTLSAAGTIQQVNLTGARLVGIERTRLVGQAFGMLVCPELRPVFRSFLKQVFADQTKQSSEFKLLSKGQPPTAVNIEVQHSPRGRECRAVVVDITDRKRAADEMRVSEVRYRRIFEAAHGGVLLLDPGTRQITDANPFMTKLLGYSHDQLVGKELFEIGLLTDKAASQEMFRKLKKNHEVRYEDLPLESRKGRRREVEVVANLYQEDGHPVIQCNIRDITERKQAEATLRTSEALFSALIAQAPVGVYVVDARFRMQQVNPTALAVFDRVPHLIGRDFSESIHFVWPKRIADQIVARFRHTLKTGEPYQSPEFAERRRDSGAEEVYEWQIQRVTLPAGEYGVVCFFNNITERKRAEATQRRLEVLDASNRKLELEIIRRKAGEKSLKQSEQHQSRLLKQSRQMEEQLRQLSRQALRVQEEERKRISRELHDVIAQSLAGINLRLGALKKEAALNPQGLERYITRTQLLVQQSVDIVHRFARELRPTVLDDVGLIPALLTFMKGLREQTGIQVSLSAYAAVEQVSSETRIMLYRVAQEALTNVTRHAHASEVEVRIQKQEDAICMEIEDNGKGFHHDPLARGKKSKRLGLLGMRERVEMVGGSLTIQSAPGEGTTIRAQMPLAKNAGGGRKTRWRSLLAEAI